MTEWHKSSFSGTNTNCVEIRWQKSSFSGGNTNCIEVASTPDLVAVRDSKNPTAPALNFSSLRWRQSLSAVTGSRSSA